jgi:cytochrome c553
MRLQLTAVISALGTLGYLLATPVLAEGNAEAGQTKSAPCVACHGVGGNSTNPEWPRLAGQHRDYTVAQLKAFKSGARSNPLMSPMAAPLTDQDIEDLAAYFATGTPQGGETEPSKLELGQKIFRGGDTKNNVAACTGCHGPRGSGNPAAKYPLIRGQQATYVASQLRAYKTATRKTDPNGIMRTVAAGLSDEQIDAVASYIQGLR